MFFILLQFFYTPLSFLQVISVDQNIVHEVTKDNECVTSDILNVKVQPTGTVFAQTVTVHLALPYQLV